MTELIELIVLVVSTFGLVNIFIYSPIMSSIRDAVIYVFKLVGKESMGKYLVGCPTCCGFWAGALLTTLYMFGHIMFALPLALSFCCYVAGFTLFPEE